MYCLTLRPWSLCVVWQGEPVDVDLCALGPARKVSHVHAVIRLRVDGMFYIKSLGKNPTYVNGKVCGFGCAGYDEP